LTLNEFAHTVFKMSNGARSMPWCRPTITDAPPQWRTMAYRGLAHRLANYTVHRTNPRTLLALYPPRASHFTIPLNDRPGQALEGFYVHSGTSSKNSHILSLMH